MKEEGGRKSACGPSEARSRRARASGGGAPRALRKDAVTATALLLLTIAAGAQQVAVRPARIISLIPAVTEMLFAVGAGEQVVGVGSFDRYPPQVEKLPRVGALLDPDVEKMLSLRPDLVVIYGSQTDLQQQLERAKVPIFVYRHAGLADVMKTMRELGGRVGRGQEADAAAGRVEAALDAVRRRVKERTKPRVLLVFDREAGALRGIYASGGVGFLHDIIELAGGTNVFADVQRQSVQAGTELILARRPDVILELRLGPLREAAARAVRSDWDAIPAVPAVRNGRVVVIADERMRVPGPRVAEAARVIAEALHPDAFK
jgi:iron complex transport system substrate-binding protein